MMTKGVKPPHGPQPNDLSGKTIHIPFVGDFDFHPFGTPFGTVLKQVNATYAKGDTVKVVFQAANLRRGTHPSLYQHTISIYRCICLYTYLICVDFRTQDTFLAVEMMNNGNWVSMRNDADFDNKLRFKSNQLRESEVTIEWATVSDTPAGKYRIRHFGTSKDLLGNLTPFTGTSATFTLA